MMQLLSSLDLAGQVSLFLLATVSLVLAFLIPAVWKQAPKSHQGD